MVTVMTVMTEKSGEAFGLYQLVGGSVLNSPRPSLATHKASPKEGSPGRGRKAQASPPVTVLASRLPAPSSDFRLLTSDI